MSYTIFVYFFLTSWVSLQAYPEDGCCGGYHIGLLENMTNTLSSSRKDRSTQLLENSKGIKVLGEEIGKYFKELGEDFGQLLEDLRKGLGDDLSENKMELKENREELRAVIGELQENREEIKRLGNRLEQNFGREIRDLKEGLGEELKENRQELIKFGQAINNFSVDLGQELKGLREEIRKGNEELRDERRAHHEEIIMVFKRILENNENNHRLNLSEASDVPPQSKGDMPSHGIGNCSGVIPSTDGDVPPQTKRQNNSAVIEKEDVSSSPDCASLYKSGKQSSGIYKIKPAGVQEGFDVYCDMQEDGGGWTVIQRRGNFGTPGDYFYKNWTEYKNGFGKLDEEHWLGNDKISSLTRQGSYELRIQMRDYDNKSMQANYKKFEVEGEEQLYKLHVGQFSGNIRDSLKYHNGMSFSTPDRKNDFHSGNCAVEHAGAWWYNKCHYSNLNSKKDRNKTYLMWQNPAGVNVDLSYVLMKIRPLSF